MKKLFLAVVLLLLVVGSAAAWQPFGASTTHPAAVAWTDSSSIYVAVANGTSVRQEVALELIVPGEWRPVAASRTVLLPAFSVLVERFEYQPRPGSTARPEFVDFVSRTRTIRIPIQDGSVFSPTSYVMPAHEGMDIAVNLERLRHDVPFTQLTVDESFVMLDSNEQGSIRIDKIEGGFYTVRWRNTVEYRSPAMLVTMRTPRISGADVLSFSVYVTQSGASASQQAPGPPTWVPAQPISARSSQQRIPGPEILVYGSNMRLIDNTAMDIWQK